MDEIGERHGSHPALVETIKMARWTLENSNPSRVAETQCLRFEPNVGAPHFRRAIRTFARDSDGAGPAPSVSTHIGSKTEDKIEIRQ
jgi:hypothetical protein